MNEVIDYLLAKKHVEAQQLKLEGKKDKQLYRTRFSLQQQTNAQEKFDRSIVENWEKAEWIYQHFEEVQAGIQQINGWIEEGLSEKSIREKMKEKEVFDKWKGQLDLNKRKLVLTF